MRSCEGDNRRKVTELKLWELFERIKTEGRPTGITEFAKEAGFHRTYIYTFPVLAEEVTAYGKLTQPAKSRRGAGVSKLEARKRQLDERARGEHKRWTKEVPELRQKLVDAESRINAQDEQIASIQRENQLLMRAYEHLLLLASEAGAGLSELEALQNKVVAGLATPARLIPTINLRPSKKNGQ